MPTPEYLSKLVDQAKSFLPAHLFKAFIAYARGHAGGKAKARNRKNDDVIKAALGLDPDKKSGLMAALFVPSDIAKKLKVDGGEVRKGFINGDPEVGVHPHSLLRNQNKTMQDGPHLHFWVMPDGEVIINREDGRHEHKLESNTADKTDKDGAHTHVLLLKDGTEVLTEKGGEHEHALLTETTAFDGLHTHKIKVDGGTIESLTAGQFIERFGPFDDQTIPLISAKFITQDIANHIMSAVNVRMEDTEVSKSDQTILAALGMTIQKQFVTQTIIISKDLHDKASDARKEALEFVSEEEGKSMKAADETSTSFRFQIRPPDNFQRLRTINPKEGTSIVGGQLKSGIDKAIHRPEDSKKKSEEASKDLLVPIIKRRKARQIVYGIVLEADIVDTQGEFMKADQIEKTAHAYIQKSRVIGLGHTKVADAELIESVLLHKGDSFYGTKIEKTSWAIGVFIKDAAIWKKVDSGEINAFSVGGFGKIDQAA